VERRAYGLEVVGETRVVRLETVPAEAAENFWSPAYIQRSAHIEPGRDGLFNLVRAAAATWRYEAPGQRMDYALPVFILRTSG
jgi:hypothetical protein